MKDLLASRLVELTRDLILIPTTVAHPEEMERGVEFIKNHLEGIEGINIQIHRSQGVPSLLALPQDQSHLEVLLCAHLDVVSLPADTLFRSTIEKGRIYGPGAADMKGPLAILLKVFKDVRLRYPTASLGLIVTTDEERGGEHGVKFLFGEMGLRCGVAIIPDSGSLNDVVVEEKGTLHLAIRCHGPSGHACRPWLVDNPLERLTDRLHDVRAMFKGMEEGEEHWHPTFSVTVLRTPNDACNRIPANAEAFCDVRFTPPLTVVKILEMIKGRLDKDMELEVLLSAETSSYSPDPLFLQVTEEITQKSVRLFREHGGSDARFLSFLGIPSIMSRPIVGNVHSENEWVDIESMASLYRIYERYLERKFCYKR